MADETAIPVRVGHYELVRTIGKFLLHFPSMTHQCNLSSICWFVQEKEILLSLNLRDIRSLTLRSNHLFILSYRHFNYLPIH